MLEYKVPEDMKGGEIVEQGEKVGDVSQGGVSDRRSVTHLFPPYWCQNLRDMEDAYTKLNYLLCLTRRFNRITLSRTEWDAYIGSLVKDGIRREDAIKFGEDEIARFREYAVPQLLPLILSISSYTNSQHGINEAGQPTNTFYRTREAWERNPFLYCECTNCIVAHMISGGNGDISIPEHHMEEWRRNQGAQQAPNNSIIVSKHDSVE